jgi:hypothetical protein
MFLKETSLQHLLCRISIPGTMKLMSRIVSFPTYCHNCRNNGVGSPSIVRAALRRSADQSGPALILADLGGLWQGCAYLCAISPSFAKNSRGCANRFKPFRKLCRAMLSLGLRADFSASSINRKVQSRALHKTLIKAKKMN